MSIDGHLWTIRPWLLHQLRPLRPPESVPWTATVADARVGPVRIHGRLTARAGVREVLVVVHGLGGSSAAQYMIAAARAAERAGVACLRLDMRGAPGDGEDLYHAGLTADLRAALSSAELSGHDVVYVLGYSLGGHVALRYATEAVDPRLAAVASVCAPIDLDRSAHAIDQPERWVYRQYVLSGLKALYAHVAARRAGAGLPSLADARAIRRIRDWDHHIVAPRFGFRSAEHYYAEASVAPRFDRLAVPALLVAATGDPMLPPETVRPALERGHALLDVRWIEGAGHVGFPGSLDLGLGGETGLEAQVLRWLRKVGSVAPARPILNQSSA